MLKHAVTTHERTELVFDDLSEINSCFRSSILETANRPRSGQNESTSYMQWQSIVRSCRTLTTEKHAEGRIPPDGDVLAALASMCPQKIEHPSAIAYMDIVPGNEHTLTEHTGALSVCQILGSRLRALHLAGFDPLHPEVDAELNAHDSEPRQGVRRVRGAYFAKPRGFHLSSTYSERATYFVTDSATSHFDFLQCSVSW